MESYMLAADVWFNPNMFGAMYGAIGGGVGGSLLGVLAPLCMLAAQRGKARLPIMLLWRLFAAIGVAQIVFGVYALTQDQPYAIWYAPALCGVIMTILSSAFLVMMHRRFEQADSRKLDAAAFRNS